MSAEGSRGTAFRVHELTRQFGRSDSSQSPNVGASPSVHQKSLPKVLSQIAKTPPTPVRETEYVTTTDSSLVSSPDSTRAEDQMSASSYESELEESLPNPAASIAQIKPTPRQPIPSTKIQTSDYVIGLDQLQEQVRRLALRRGFTLNIMVVGKSRSWRHHPFHLYRSTQKKKEERISAAVILLVLLFHSDLIFAWRTQWTRKVDPHQHIVSLFGTASYVYGSGIRTF